MQMGDMCDGGPFHAFHGAAGPGFDRAGVLVGTRAGRHGDEAHAPRYREDLHRQLIEQRNRRFDDGESECLHIEETGGTRCAQISITFRLGAHDVAYVEAGRRIRATDSADDDLPRSRVRKEQRDSVRGVDRTDAGSNDRRRLHPIEPLAKERAFQFCCHTQ
jgi:hypothetical protein